MKKEQELKLTFSSLAEYKNYFRKLIEKERDSVKQFHLEEIAHLTGKEREKRGRAFLGLQGQRTSGPFMDYFFMRFWRKESFPEHEFQPGDWVLITQRSKPSPTDPSAMVYRIGKNSIVLAFPEKPPRFQKRKPFRIDLFVNDITFTRMFDALANLFSSFFLTPFLLGKSEPETSSPLNLQGLEDFLRQSPLNFSQQEAIQSVLQSEFPFGLIHGPPGTGKTTTLAYLIWFLTQRGYRILATAHSNVAVDNLMEQLLNLNVSVIRVGNPIKITPALEEHTLAIQMQTHRDYPLLQEWRQKVEALITQRNQYQKPVPALRRGLSDQAIFQLAEQKRGSRGISPHQIQAMAQWLRLQENISAYFEDIKRLENQIILDTLRRHQVVCATASGAATVEDQFDIVVVDEAAQAIEPALLVPFLKARQRVFLAGDDQQLPPTVLAEEICPQLAFSLFERWHRLYPQSAHLLRVQYRMHEAIMTFSNIHFYQRKLIAHDSVKQRTFPYSIQDWSLPYAQAWGKEPLVFIPHSGEEKEERFSYYNLTEIAIIKELISSVLKNSIPIQEIGIIAPYTSQIRRLKEALPISGLEIHTVDGFQGREKEAIILSLIRSNPHQKIGFLKEYRRLNVSLTRAKSKLIILMNPKNFMQDKIYRALFDYLVQNALVIPKY